MATARRAKHRRGAGVGIDGGEIDRGQMENITLSSDCILLKECTVGIGEGTGRTLKPAP
jgi:hypothetical protein